MLCPYRERVGVMAGEEYTKEVVVNLSEETNDTLEEEEDEEMDGQDEE